MLGTGSPLLSAGRPGARAERVVRPLPRGARIARGLVARSARTDRAPARSRHRRLADAFGPRPGQGRPPPWGRPLARLGRRRPTAGARPASVPGWPRPTVYGPRHLHVTGRFRATP